MLTLLKIHPGKIVFFFLFLHYYGFLYGLFFGYLCGTVIDRLIALHRKRKVENLLFLALGKLARADGQIHAEEIRRAEMIFKQLGITGERREQAINHFRLGAKPDFDIDDEIRHFIRKGVPLTQRSALLEMLIIFSIENLDDRAVLNPDYSPLLEHIAVLLEIPRHMFRTMLSILIAQANFHHFGGSSNSADWAYNDRGAYTSPPMSADMLATAYQALGASESDSDTEIKKKYRRLVNRFHPDKIAGQGFGMDAVELAKEKTQQVQSAYDQIKRVRGMK